MRVHLLLGLLTLLASSCESSKCPATVYEAQGSCSGNAVCNYSGCANPGDTCRCRDGHWSCVTTTCRRDQSLPWPDALARDGKHSEARADDGRPGDARSKDAAPREGGLAEGAACAQSDDRCAAGLKCCLTCCGVPPMGDATVVTHTCVKPLANGNCPPPPP